MDLSRDLRALKSVEDEVSRRLVRTSRIDVLDYKPSSVLPETQLAPTGSIAVYVAKKGNLLLNEVREAARDSKGGRDRKLARRVQRQIGQRQQVSVAEAARRAIAQPVLADLSFAGQITCKHLFIEDDEQVGATMLPYAGGDLPADAFQFTEYYYADEDESLECVLIKNPPYLSSAEKAAIKLVPPDLVRVFVASGDIVANTVLWLTAAVALEVVFVWATFTMVKALDDKSMEHINPAAIDSLGPVGTARALVRMRRDLLKGKAGAQQAAAAEQDQM